MDGSLDDSDGGAGHKEREPSMHVRETGASRSNLEREMQTSTQRPDEAAQWRRKEGGRDRGEDGPMLRGCSSKSPD